jgi:hypothetical protein
MSDTRNKGSLIPAIIRIDTYNQEADVTTGDVNPIDLLNHLSTISKHFAKEIVQEAISIIGNKVMDVDGYLDWAINNRSVLYPDPPLRMESHLEVEREGRAVGNSTRQTDAIVQEFFSKPVGTEIRFVDHRNNKDSNDELLDCIKRRLQDEHGLNHEVDFICDDGSAMEWTITRLK